MAINFPNNPNPNDTWSEVGKTWLWDGTSWKLNSTTASGISLTDLSVTKPNPTPQGNGDVTYNNTTGVFTYTPPVVGSTSFTGLSDTPGTLTAGKWLKVNAGGTALEWTDAPTGNDTNDYLNTASLSGNTLTLTRTGTQSLSNVTVDLSSLNSVPTSITVADESTDTECYPLFTKEATGDLEPKTGSNIKFNSASGQLEAGSFKKTGGTAAEFLKADGSIDTSTYLSSVTLNDLSNVDAVTNVSQGKILKYNGTSWEVGDDNASGGGGGATTINNNADNRIITGSATANTLNAESSLTYDGTKLNLGDDKKITFGSNLRMEIYTDGSTNYIKTPTDGSGAFPISIYSGSSEVIKIDDGNTQIKTGLKDYVGDLGNPGQILSSTGTQINWVNASSGALNDLTDVDTSGAANLKILRHNGTEWQVSDEIQSDWNESNANLTAYIKNKPTGILTSVPTLDAVLGAGNTSTKAATVGNFQCANLTVTGTTTTVNSNTVNIGDSNLTLNSDETGTPSQNGGLTIDRGTSTNVELRWNETTDKWQYTNDGSTYENIGSSVDLTSYVKKTEAASLTLTRTGSNNFIVVNTESYFDLNTSAQCTIDAGGQFAVDAVGQIQLHSDSYAETKSTRFDFKNVAGNSTYAQINSSGLNLYTGGIKDKDGQLGTAGQVLSSTGSSLDWIDVAAGSDTLADVTGRGNTTTTTCSFQSTTHSTLTATGLVTAAFLNVKDPKIVLNSDFSGSSPTEDAFLRVERGNDNDVNIKWNESSNKWQATDDGSSYYDLNQTNTNNYASSFSWNTGNGVLTLNRSGLSAITVDLDGRYATGTIPTNNNQLTNGANYITSSGTVTNSEKIRIRTDTDNTMHNLVFVDSYSDNQFQILKVDNATNSLCYNPWSNRLIGQDFQSFRMTDWSGSYGTDGQFLMSNGSGQWGWSTKIHQESNGEIRISGPSGSSTNLEGGHLQFEDSSGNTSYAIDVYRNSVGANIVMRFIDQSQGLERFSVGPQGQWGIGHVGGRDFGSLGQVMISRGPNLSPQWGDHSGISGSEIYATNAQGAKADTADADINEIYAQLVAIGNDDTIATVAQLKIALLELART